MANNGSRNTRRPGMGVQSGSINKPIHIGTTAPANPVHKEIWLDITDDPLVIKWYDENTTSWKTGS